MKSSKSVEFKLFCLLGFALILADCAPKTQQQGDINALSCTPSASTNVVSSLPPSGSNVMSVTVNGSLCSNGGAYQNEPCVSVTICAPGTSNCETINNILLDTGSYGLRIFSSLISVPLTPVTTNTGQLAECVQFGDGSSEWGQVETADIKMGGEPAVTVPIEVINSSYATPPAPCSASQSSPDTNPQQAGFNGILGLGLLVQDCGTLCTTQAGVGQYYTCTGSTCGSTTATLNQQVANPAALLPVDNNGIILELPSVGDGGTQSVSGSVVFGIGTESNNKPTGVTALNADQYATFQTAYDTSQSSPLVSFIDSGSNFLYFPPPASGLLVDCAGGNEGLFCPSSTVNLSAVNMSATGSAMNCVGFQVANADQLLNTGSMVFSNIGGNGGTGLNAMFDWGLPFFFGKNIYVGFEGAKSSLASGSYWAY